jgi:acetylornithine deacetylase/succinyl-diaminopimelate desuccinylase-like protein
LFALERPEVQVLTAGPGELRYAHSDAEQADVSDIARFAAFLARFIMVRCGTVPAAGRTGE